ncbi:hypothetical protein NDU88_007914 [Pleurodeles waltl]|uniref:Uncharacterized protein n=1 Tax=Pleurodeles waltl TaxID=8319 RepID=A0AAV7QM56_PLEWA|nr:hypothetical protein NDU88_007914 [Pleurodeles waltl]
MIFKDELLVLLQSEHMNDIFSDRSHPLLFPAMQHEGNSLASLCLPRVDAVTSRQHRTCRQQVPGVAARRAALTWGRASLRIGLRRHSAAPPAGCGCLGQAATLSPSHRAARKMATAAEGESLETITEHERILQEIESTDTACVGPTLR